MPDRRTLRRAEGHLRRADRVLGAAISEIGPCGLDEVQRADPLRALAESIIHQQLSIRAAATIHRRFLDLFPRRRPSARRILDLPDDELRGVGLSAQKVRYLRDLADSVRRRRLPLRRLQDMDDDEVVEALTEVKGIGRWTAHMYLIFRLGRLDVLPVDDLGIVDAARLLYGLDERPGADELARIAEPWRPYRSVASWYLWRSRRAGGLDPEA